VGEQKAALILLFIIFSLLLFVPQIRVVKAVSKTYELQLLPEAYEWDTLVELRKGDRIKGSFTVSNIGPYQSFFGGNSSFWVNVKLSLNVMDRPEQVVCDFSNTSGGSFDYVTAYAGIVEVNTFCGGKLGFINASDPVLTLNYEVERKPIELINPDLLAWWRLDEGNGTVVTDSSGNEYEGIIHGATWIDNQGNISLNFNGESDYVSLPSMNLTEIDALTVVTWINSDLTEKGYIMFHGNLGQFTLANAYLDEENPTTHPTYVRFSVKLNPHYWYSVQSSFPLKPNTWHQVVGMWEKGVALQVYIDGILAGENNTIPSERLYDPSLGGSWPSSLGIDMQGYYNTQAFFKGQISNVMVFNKTLTNQELIDLYDCGPFDAPDDIPEFPSWLILPLFLVATLFGVVLRKKFRVQFHLP
jgi:hypothetical protein